MTDKISRPEDRRRKAEKSPEEKAFEEAREKFTPKEEDFKPHEATIEERESAQMEEEPLRKSPLGGLKFGVGGANPALIAIVVSAILTFGLISLLAPSKGQYETDFTQFASELATMREVDSSLKSANDSQSNSISGHSTKIATVETAIADYESRIALLRTDINTLNTDYAGKADTTALTALDVEKDAQIANLQSQITTLQGTVSDLEDELDSITVYGTTTTTGDTTTSGEVTTYINTTPGYVASASPTGDPYQYVITIVNNSSVSTKKVHIEAIASVVGVIPGGLNVNATDNTTAFAIHTPDMQENNTFSMTYVPVGRITGISNGFMYLAPGANAMVIINFTLAYNAGSPPATWTVVVKPIATDL